MALFLTRAVPEELSSAVVCPLVCCSRHAAPAQYPALHPLSNPAFCPLCYYRTGDAVTVQPQLLWLRQQSGNHVQWGDPEVAVPGLSGHACPLHGYARLAPAAAGRSKAASSLASSMGMANSPPLASLPIPSMPYTTVLNYPRVTQHRHTSPSHPPTSHPPHSHSPQPSTRWFLTNRNHQPQPKAVQHPFLASATLD